MHGVAVGGGVTVGGGVGVISVPPLTVIPAICAAGQPADENETPFRCISNSNVFAPFARSVGTGMDKDNGLASRGFELSPFARVGITKGGATLGTFVQGSVALHLYPIMTGLSAQLVVDVFCNITLTVKSCCPAVAVAPLGRL